MYKVVAVIITGVYFSQVKINHDPMSLYLILAPSLTVIGLSLPILRQRWRCLMYDVYLLSDGCCLGD